MKAATHTHPCSHCKTPVECYGNLEENDDGFPTVICRGYHQSGGTLARILCEDCATDAPDDDEEEA